MATSKTQKINKSRSWVQYLRNPNLVFFLALIGGSTGLAVIRVMKLQETIFPPVRTIAYDLPVFIQQLPLTNYAFLLFLMLAVISFYLTPPKLRWLPIVIFNTYFISGFGFQTIIPLSITTLISFLAALVISKQEKQKSRKLVMQIGNLLVIAMLFFYKYSVPMTWSVYKLFHTPVIALLFPLGLSFYSFQAIAYITDVYTQKRPVIKNFGLYYASLSFFPKFSSGPIERDKGYIEQFIRPRKLDIFQFQLGIARIFWGISKKVILANRMVSSTTTVFANPMALSSLETWISVILYSLYIYIDFSAYCDIAIGSAQLFGIQLTENFNRPYFATSIQEFWQRWHISLSTWLNDYIFQPLNFSSRRLKSKLPTVFHILIVFVISGIWHGAAVTFILWGALHGLYQIIGYVISPVRKKFSAFIGIEENSLSSKLYQIPFTFLLVTITWVFFGTNSIGTIKTIFSNLAFHGESLFGYSVSNFGITKLDLDIILIGIVILFAAELGSRKRNLFEIFVNLHFPLKLSLLLLFILTIILLGQYQLAIVNNFVYDAF